MSQLNDTSASGGKGEQCHWHADQGIDMVSAKFNALCVSIINKTGLKDNSVD